MDVNQKALLKLIAKSQFGVQDEYSFEGVDWDVVYKEAKDQSVLGLVASEIPAEYVDAKWQQAQYKQIVAYIKYCHAEEELKTVMAEANIPFVVLKGNSAAVAYKDPTKRAMGDIDFLVPNGLYENAKQVLSDNGFTEHSSNSRHTSYQKNYVMYELHKRFSYEDIDIEDIITLDQNITDEETINDHRFPMLNKASNGMVLLLHMRQHLKDGMGLRQVIDWMMYVYRNVDDSFWEHDFFPVAQEKGMVILAIIATRMCQLYLGLPEVITWCSNADEEICEELLMCVMTSGNFGRKNEYSGAAVETVSTNFKRVGLFRYLQMSGEKHWERYHKHHWLKPFCWIYQGFRYAKQGLNTGRSRKQIKGDLERANRRYELLKKLNID